MPSNTTEFWDVDGTSLNQFAWSVTTIGGSRLALPPLRGEDVAYAYRIGKEFRPKIPDSKVIVLQMWAVGLDPALGLDDPAAYDLDQGVQFTSNFRTLQRLFWTPGSQVALTRRWDEGAGVVAGTALAQVAGSMEPIMTGRTRADFEVPLLLADPYFYGVEQSSELELNTPTNLTNIGDVATTGFGVELEFMDALTNPQLTNATPDPDVFVRLGLTVVDTDSVLLQVQKYIATRTSDSANVIGSVSHSGARTWMGLQTGVNSLTLTADGGTGSVDVRWRPPYV